MPTSNPGKQPGGGGVNAPAVTPEQQAQAEQRFAQRDAMRKEVKKTTKSQIQKMKKSKLIDFIGKAIIAIATSPAQLATQAIKFQERAMSASRDALIKIATNMKGMV